MKIVLVSIITLLFSGVGICVESPRQIKPEKCVTTNQNTHEIQYGTEQSPFIIKTVQSTKSKEESERDADERNDRKTLNKFTFWLAIVGTLQFIALGLQIYFLCKTLRSTEKAVNSTQESERPYVFIEVESYSITPLDNEQFKWIANYIMRNQGKTPAILTGIQCTIWYNNGDNPKVKQPMTDWLSSGGVVIGAGKVKRLHTPETTLSFNDNTNLTGVFCYGRIDYEDIFKVAHYTTFCREFQSRNGVRVFGIHHNEELNKYT